MKLKEIMTDDVEVVSPELSVREAAQRMADLDIGSLPVCDGERLVGIITDRDITIKATALGLNPEDVPVRDVMTSPIVYCYDDSEVEDAAELMETNQIRRLPVLNRDKKLIGVVALGDIATRGPKPQLTAKTLEGVSETHRSSIH